MGKHTSWSYLSASENKWQTKGLFYLWIIFCWVDFKIRLGSTT